MIFFLNQKVFIYKMIWVFTKEGPTKKQEQKDLY